MIAALPPGWVRVRVGDLAQDGEQPVLTGPFGTSMGSDDFVSKGCPVLTIGCLTDAGIRMSKAAHVRPEKAAELDRYRLRAGDLLFSRMASVGRAGIVPPELDGALFNYHIMRLRLSGAVMLPDLFLAYVRGAPDVRKYLEDVNHGATRDGINTTQLVEMPVALPPMNEQRRIVAKLESLQARSRRAREALDAVPPLLEKLRQSILAAAFRGDLTKEWRAKHKDVEPAEKLLARIRVERRKKWEEAELAKMKAKGKRPIDDQWKAKYKEPEPVEETDLPELPDGWCWASTDELFSFVTSGSRGWAEHYANDGALFLRIGNLDHDSIDLDLADVQRVRPPVGAEGERTRVEAGDVLISITADLGMVAVVPESFEPAYVNQHIALARPAWSVPAAYLALYLSAPLNGKRLLLRANRGATKAGLGLDDIRSVPVPLPPTAEASQVVHRSLSAVRLIRRFRDRQADHVVRLGQLDRATLAKAFRGELVPQDPNDEPADVMLAQRPAASSTQSSDSAKAAPKRGRRGATSRGDAADG